MAAQTETEPGQSPDEEIATNDEESTLVKDDQYQLDNDGTTVNHSSFTFREHVKHLISLTGPIIIAEIGQNALPIVDIAFVGNLPNKEDLAAAALAIVWFNLWNTSMIGFMTAIDTVLAQSYGAGEMETFSMWTGLSIMIVIGAALIVSGFISLCGPAMKLLGQDLDIADSAGQFSVRLVPGLIPYYLFKVLTKFLQSQNKVYPGVIIGFFANLFNAFFNWFFIYYLGYGLLGGAWATSLTRIVEFIFIILYIFLWKRPQLKDLKDSFLVSIQNLAKPAIVRPFMKLAIAGTLSLSCEAWSFEVSGILAGLIGVIALDAHAITISVATFIFLSFPFAVGIATSIRVGQLIGEGRAADAKRSYTISTWFTMTLQAILTFILLPCSDLLGRLFSADEAVSNLVAKLIPISCVFMLGDAIQANIAGALRGLGRQKLVLVMNVLGFWFLAVPIGAILAFVANVGVAGLWWGFNIGIYSASIFGLVILYTRINWEDEVIRARSVSTVNHQTAITNTDTNSS